MMTKGLGRKAKKCRRPTYSLNPLVYRSSNIVSSSFLDSERGGLLCLFTAIKCTGGGNHSLIKCHSQYVDYIIGNKEERKLDAPSVRTRDKRVEGWWVECWKADWDNQFGLMTSIKYLRIWNDQKWEASEKWAAIHEIDIKRGHPTFYSFYSSRIMWSLQRCLPSLLHLSN